MHVHLTSTVVAALTLAFVSFASPAAMAASACPGGGTQKCTFHCSGPLTNPVCTEGPPCTCTLGARPTVGAARGAAYYAYPSRVRRPVIGGVNVTGSINRAVQPMRSGGGGRHR